MVLKESMYIVHQNDAHLHWQKREGGRVVNGAQNGKLRSETGPGSLSHPNFLNLDSRSYWGLWSRTPTPKLLDLETRF